MKANFEALIIFVSVKKLGVSLLNHTNRQLSLTDEGKHYFNHIQPALQEMKAAENELMESKDIQVVYYVSMLQLLWYYIY